MKVKLLSWIFITIAVILFSSCSTERGAFKQNEKIVYHLFSSIEKHIYNAIKTKMPNENISFVIDPINTLYNRDKNNEKKYSYEIYVVRGEVELRSREYLKAANRYIAIHNKLYPFMIGTIDPIFTDNSHPTITKRSGFVHYHFFSHSNYFIIDVNKRKIL